ncbi:NRP2 [Branchiostoma lanceolatum]|uniref:NRP2 protein n=1 Tax=Branchiostoma lanceolatum TaxID=7740 RepID=A0A8K0A4M0_BRALA|nr:NRP2 [Branchiostoma lanceolatum]
MAFTSHPRCYFELICFMVHVVFIIATGATTVHATCGRELGMKSGSIKNEQITASTISGDWYAYYARIDDEYAWYPSTYNTNQWLQVDLRHQTVITGVETQGHSWTYSYYVKTFKLQFRVGNTTTMFQNAFDGKVFQGSSGANQIKVNNFPAPIVASAIRFLPQSWYYRGIALRVELLGCNLSEIPTRTTSTRPPVTTVPSPATTVPSVASSTKSPSNISAGLSSIIPIAAGAGGGLVLLVVIVVIVIVCRRKRRGRSDTVKLDDLQGPPGTSVRTEDRPEDVTFVHNDMYESVDNTGTTGHRLGEHPEEVGLVRNDMYESVNRTGEDSSSVTLLPASEGAAALYSVVDKKPCGADDEGMVDNIIYG